MTTNLPTNACETFFTDAILRKNHGQIESVTEGMLVALANNLSIDYFNQRNHFGEKIVFWVIKNNRYGALHTLIDRFGDDILMDLDNDHHDAIAIATASNQDGRLDSIIRLLLRM
jgi:hypothetical protein